MPESSPTRPGSSAADRDRRALALFADLVDRPGPDRSRILDESCADDPELRAAIDRLLDADAAAERAAFLGPPAPARPPQDAERPPQDDALARGLEGAQVGRFRLKRLIATGGMGAVFEAEQESPRRIVALKVLKPVFAAGLALRRFQVEVEILARLKHPGIAQVHEAGVHPFAQGPLRFDLPWFAMELLEGARPLDRYAAEHGLGLGERLALFVRACEAVHHAHQRGVIHRDLKPENILVDAAGVPKVIDFGIAHRDAGESSLDTRPFDLLGTPRYMAPEQVDGRADQVDVRTDVYALGVVLFELLTGASPLDVDGKDLPAAIRAIRELPPRRARSLAPDLPRPLEWVVDKALAKDPARRYASVDALASDLLRFARHEPLEAAPPSATYRVRTYVRRNRLMLSIAAVIVVLLAGWIVSLQRTLKRAVDAEGEAQQRAIETLTEVDIASNALALISFAIDSARGETNLDISVRQLLEHAAKAVDVHPYPPQVEAALCATIGEWQHKTGDDAKAEQLLRRALRLLEGADRSDTIRAMNCRGQLADALLALGRVDEALEQLALVRSYELEIKEPATLDNMAFTRANAMIAEGSYRAAEDCLLPRVQRYLDGAADPNSALLTLQNSLVFALEGQARFGEAESLARSAVDRQIALRGEKSGMVAVAKNTLGTTLLHQGRAAEAEPLLRAGIERQEAIYSKTHRRVLTGMGQLAGALLELDRPQEALDVAEELERRRVESDGGEHPDMASALRLQGLALVALGRPADALPKLERALAIARSKRRAEHQDIGFCLASLGRCHAALGRKGDAAGEFDEALRILAKTFGADQPRMIELAAWRAELGS